jgi:hypothetical protein
VKGFSAEVNFFWFKKFTGAVYKIYRTVIIIHLLCCAISSKNKEDEAIFAINPAYRRVFFMPLKLVTNQNKKTRRIYYGKLRYYIFTPTSAGNYFSLVE